jgi:hypothetical protein
MHVALPPPHRVKKNAFYQNKIRIKGFHGLRSCFDLPMKNLGSVVYLRSDKNIEYNITFIEIRFYGLRSCFDLSMKNLDSVVTIGNLNKVQNINLVLSISD